jgi:hypothetical protein
MAAAAPVVPAGVHPAPADAPEIVPAALTLPARPAERP